MPPVGDDLKAKELEQSFLRFNRPLSCGCVITTAYTHPVEAWLYTQTGRKVVCAQHQAIDMPTITDLMLDKRLIGASYVPLWVTEHGNRILRTQWMDTLDAAIPRPLVTTRGRTYMLLRWYDGTFTNMVYRLMSHSSPVFNAVCMDVDSMLTEDIEVSSDLLRAYGWDEKAKVRW